MKRLSHPFKAVKKPHKYGAKATVVRGRKYPSKLEGAFAESLWLAKEAGTILFWLEQVPFHFKSGIKYLVDFAVFYEDGGIEFVEVKGRETKNYKLKMRLLADEYPDVDVVIVR